MNGYFGTSGMWYKSGKFYELQTTHVNFFLNKPWLLGFSQTEKKTLRRKRFGAGRNSVR